MQVPLFALKYAALAPSSSAEYALNGRELKPMDQWVGIDHSDRPPLAFPPLALVLVMIWSVWASAWLPAECQFQPVNILQSARAQSCVGP